ncbi:hypothetical protein [Clostridium tagluense]|uniref:Uncharacterized protein n=1 Tax=Clostridium tagluense TaxID=360422 RepID=A0A401UN73_9CLOT|nr:hypothetical protein [Clostridium tagluense]GCD10968.1 hypothetical protein Ctaglu_25910 [Clostridium tagluense]
MPNCLNSTVIGIDVASAFSFASILCLYGSMFRKPFKINHTVEGLNHFLEQIKKAINFLNLWLTLISWSNLTRCLS